MNKLLKIPTCLLQENHFVFAIQWFRRCIYFALLFDILTTINHWSTFYAPDALTHLVQVPTGFISGFFTLLTIPPFANFYLVVIWIYILLLLLGLFGKYPKIAALGVYFIFKTLCFKAPEITNGGHHLLNMLLFFNVFLSESKQHKNKLFNMLSNISVYACQIQIALMYFFSAWYKLQGTEWIQGNALYLLAKTEGYSTPFFSYIFKIQWIAVIANYFALGYQAVFPFLVWFKKVKKGLLVLGIVFHVFILWMAGVADFAIFCIASYTIFLNQDSTSVFPNLKTKTKTIGIIGD